MPHPPVTVERSGETAEAMRSFGRMRVGRLGRRGGGPWHAAAAIGNACGDRVLGARAGDCGPVREGPARGSDGEDFFPFFLDVLSFRRYNQGHREVFVQGGTSHHVEERLDRQWPGAVLAGRAVRQGGRLRQETAALAWLNRFTWSQFRTSGNKEALHETSVKGGCADFSQMSPVGRMGSDWAWRRGSEVGHFLFGD